MNNNNIIELQFKNTVTNLAGNRLGNDVYLKQIESKLDITVLNVVIFPETIEDIASSFIEGLYKKLGEKYGKSKALNLMELKAKNVETDEKIKESIDTFGV